MVFGRILMRIWDGFVNIWGAMGDRMTSRDRKGREVKGRKAKGSEREEKGMKKVPVDLSGPGGGRSTGP